VPIKGDDNGDDTRDNTRYKAPSLTQSEAYGVREEHKRVNNRNVYVMSNFLVILVISFG